MCRRAHNSAPPQHTNTQRTLKLDTAPGENPLTRPGTAPRASRLRHLAHCLGELAHCGWDRIGARRAGLPCTASGLVLCIALAALAGSPASWGQVTGPIPRVPAALGSGAADDALWTSSIDAYANQDLGEPCEPYYTVVLSA